MRVLRCVVASPADWRRVLRDVSRRLQYYFRFNGKWTFDVAGDREFFSAVQRLSDCWPACEFRRQYLIFVKPEVAVSRPEVFLRHRKWLPPAQIHRLRWRRVWRSFLFRLRLHYFCHGKGHSSPHFSTHFALWHDRPSQQLLSSYYGRSM